MNLPAANFLLNIRLIGQINDCGASLIARLYVRVSMEMIVCQLVCRLICLHYGQELCVIIMKQFRQTPICWNNSHWAAHNYADVAAQSPQDLRSPCCQPRPAHRCQPHDDYSHRQRWHWAWWLRCQRPLPAGRRCCVAAAAVAWKSMLPLAWCCYWGCLRCPLAVAGTVITMPGFDWSAGYRFCGFRECKANFLFNIFKYGKIFTTHVDRRGFLRAKP